MKEDLKEIKMLLKKIRMFVIIISLQNEKK